MSTPRSLTTGSALPLKAAVVVAGGMSGVGVNATAEVMTYATVTTDQANYLPGQTVTITGTGWAPGETVQLVFHEDPTLEPDFTFTTVADGNGNILNTQFQPNSQDVGVGFYLTATGLQSGFQAQTTFSDGNVVIGITYTPNSIPPSAPLLPGQTVTVTATAHGNPVGSVPDPTCGTITFLYNAQKNGSGGTPFPSGPVQLNGTSTATQTISTLTIGTSYFSASYDPSTCVPNPHNYTAGGADGKQYIVDGTISGTVYTDANLNRTFDGGDTPLAGVTVTLTPSSGSPTNTTSAPDGTYSFSPEPGGTYTITVGTASGEILETTSPLSVTLGPGNSTGNDFGFVATGAISGEAYTDANLDKTLDNGEVGLVSVTVTLTGTDFQNNAVSKTTTTAADGTYSFTNLAPGTYAVSAPASASSENRDTSGSINVSLGSGQTSTGNNFGYVVAGTISGNVYTDTNLNKTLDAGDTPLGSVTVTLTGSDLLGNAVSKTTTSAPDGTYSSPGLAPGTYTVSAPATSGGESSDTPTSINVSLGSGQTSANNNFGYYLPGTISGNTYVDTNLNKALDSGDTPLGSVTVTLTGTDFLGNAVSKTTTSAAAGTYSFTNLTPGTYGVSAPATASGDTADTPGSISSLSLGSGQTLPNNNFGYVAPGTISGNAYTDANLNKTLDTGDTPLGSVTITLTGTDLLGNAVSKTTISATDGTYSFTNLVPGTYSLSAPGTASGETADTPGSITSLSLGNGQTLSNNNFGYVAPGTISGTTYTDANLNKTFDTGDTPLGSVSVTLTGTDFQSNAVSKTATTAANGTYSFTNLMPGTYTVTAPGTASSETADTPSAIASLSLGSGQTLSNNNFGYVAPGTISGNTYTDVNLSKSLDTGDTPLGSVQVALTGTDLLGNAVSKTTNSASDGTYSFTNLLPGSYSVSAPGTASGETADTSSSIASLSLGSGQTLANNNFGYVAPGSISGLTFTDVNLSRTYGTGDTPLASVPVTLTGTDFRGNAVSLSTTSGSNGSYSFPNVLPGAYTVSTPSTSGGETQDTPGSITVNLASGQNSANNNFGYVAPGTISGLAYTDVNLNKSYGSGDTPLASVPVTLTGTDFRGTAVSQSTTTGSNGTYSFPNVMPGTYAVSAPGTTSGETADTPNSISVSLGSGQTSANNNFGYVAPGSISGIAYTDVNLSRSYGAGDTPLGSVAVTLTGTDFQGNAVSLTATTAANGSYSFPSVAPGTYTVSAPGTVGTETADTPSSISVTIGSGQASANNNFGYIAPASISGNTYTDVNLNKTLDSGDAALGSVTVTLTGTDFQGNAVSKTTSSSTGGAYSFTNLAPGSYTVSAPGTTSGETADTPGTINVSLGSGQNSANNNFGYVAPGSISGITYTDVNLSRTYGTGDTPLASVLVTLTGTDFRGNAVSLSTTSGSNGTYSFPSLLPGSYTVSAPTSTGGENADTPGSITVSLGSGQTSASNNFGYVAPGSISGTTYTDVNLSKTYGTGDTPLASVPVTLTGTDFQGNAVSLSTTSSSTGAYSFPNLAPGTYTVAAPTSAGGETADTASSISVSLGSGQNSANNNFGYVAPGSISGITYTDVNLSHTYGTGDTPLASVPVALTGTDFQGNAVSLSTTSSGTGAYSVPNLAPGTYTVSAPASAGGETADTASSLSVSLGSGQNSANNNFGYVAPASISGTTYTDVNANRVFDTGDTGLGSVTVT
jgi:uncharacterized protein (DUF2141 family)